MRTKFIPKKFYGIDKNGKLISGWLGKSDQRGSEKLAILQYSQNPVLEDETGYYRILRGKKIYLKTK